jgi:hypothetical protein
MNSPIFSLINSEQRRFGAHRQPRNARPSGSHSRLRGRRLCLIGRIDTVPVTNSQVRDVLGRVENNNGDVDVILVDPQGRAQHKGLN